MSDQPGKMRLVAPPDIWNIEQIKEYFLGKAVQERIRREQLHDAYTTDWNRLMMGLQLIIARHPELKETASRLMAYADAWVTIDAVQQEEIKPELSHWLSKCKTKTVPLKTGKNGTKVDIIVIEPDDRQMTAQQLAAAMTARYYQSCDERLETQKKAKEHLIVRWRENPVLEVEQEAAFMGKGEGPRASSMTADDLLKELTSEMNKMKGPKTASKSKTKK